ncbi:MAG: hypothetical protein A4E20_11840 [Nitrospira sp. SG-bin2]|nr:MAG: hypothetical protein A4E20_11840 [Nitrospira sp. SG-bin2]
MANISLRPVVESDRDQLREWRNLPHVRKFMFTDHVIGPEEHAAWFAKALTRDDAKYWIIEVDGQGVGMASVIRIDRANQHCSWGFYIAEQSATGKGVGTFVDQWIIRYVFDTLGLNKLHGEVIGDNPIMRIHEKLGMRRDGCLRQHIFRDGKFLDLHMVSILRDDWENWLAETEMSQQFWEQYDREIAEIRAKMGPRSTSGFDTADLDGQ